MYVKLKSVTMPRGHQVRVRKTPVAHVPSQHSVCEPCARSISKNVHGVPKWLVIGKLPPATRCQPLEGTDGCRRCCGEQAGQRMGARRRGAAGERVGG